MPGPMTDAHGKITGDKMPLVSIVQDDINFPSKVIRAMQRHVLKIRLSKNGSRKTRRRIRDVVHPVLGKTEDYSPTQMFYKEIGFKQTAGGTRMADKCSLRACVLNLSA